MILSGQTIRKLEIIKPHNERTVIRGRSYGLSIAGYDIRIDQSLSLEEREFCLASSCERFVMPNNIIGLVKDKSSWARKGLSVFNTIIEPGWQGYLTLELVNHGDFLIIERGDPIAQVVFEFLDEEAETPYTGKYQNQKSGPQKAILENV